jgi:hypothetical protein
MAEDAMYHLSYLFHFEMFLLGVTTCFSSTKTPINKMPLHKKFMQGKKIYTRQNAHR